MVEEHFNIKKQRLIFNYIGKFRSSVTNKYCLFCRSEIVEKKHYCEVIKKIENIVVEKYFELDDDFKKTIIEELRDPLIQNEEGIENIRNKILAYSL